MKRLLTIAGLLGLFPGLRAADHSFEINAVAAVLMAEGRSEGPRGMTAIAEVIRNRGPNPFVEIMRFKQFSCLNGRRVGSLVREMSKKYDWPKAQAIAKQLFDHPETLGDSVRGANHYEAVGLKPFWTVGLRPVATIGNFNFYSCR